MLLGLLQEITDAAQSSEVDVSNVNTQHIGTPTPRSRESLVGPTTAELESLNELIRFDHIYYKSEGGEKVKCVSSKDIASSNDVTNILSLPESSVNIQQNMAQPKPNAPTTESSRGLDFESELNLNDMMQLGDTLNDLVDLDALLQDNLLSTATPNDQNNRGSTSLMTKGTKVHSVVPQSEPAPKKRKLQHSRSLIGNAPAFKKITLSTPIQSKPVVLSPPVQSKPAELLGAQSLFGLESSGSVSDSGYSSELSEAASPCSDISSVLGDDVWEESFTELFPSLL